MLYQSVEAFFNIGQFLHSEWTQNLIKGYANCIKYFSLMGSSPHQKRQKLFVTEEIPTMLDRFFNLNDEAIDITKNILDIWVEKLFSVIFIASLIAAILPYLSNMKISISSGRIFLAVFYTLCFLIAIHLTFFKIVPFKIRAWVGLSLFYLIGVISLYTVGPDSAGRMWLLLFAALSALLLGLKAGVIAMVVNIATIFFWVFAWIDNYFTWTLGITFVPNQAVSTGFSFIFMNFVLTISIGIFTSVLKERFKKEKILFNDLTLSNKRLEKENNERKHAELALRESEERYRIILDVTSDGLWDINIKTGETYYSPTFAKTLGYSVDDFQGKKDLIRELVHPDDASRVLREIHDHLNGLTEEYRIDHRFLNRDGTWQWVLNRGKVVERDTQNKPMRFLGTVEDITQYKIMQKEKEALELQLKQAQKMEAIGTLAGGIAHDFNNILSPIIMYSEMTMVNLPRKSPVYHNVNQILKSSLRARDLVKQILTFGRKSEQTVASIKIIPIIKESLKMLRSSLPTTIEIVKDIATQCDTVMADPTQIHQILLNICTNAAHAMEREGGTLKVRLSEEEINSTISSLHPDALPGPYLKIEVSDTGQGMDEETAEKIFEPYFTTKELGRGTGLGLAVVHGIVKDYDGFINVESTPGKGTTVNVFLPKVVGDCIQVSDQPDEILKGSERILLVDDEKAAVDAGKLMLNSLGYNVKSRTSSVEALEMFRNSPNDFDLVITDMTMPNMTGKDLSKEILNIRPDIPIILCTGYSTIIDEDQAKKMGIKAFMMKPIITHEIARVIRSVIKNESQSKQELNMAIG